MWLYQNLVEFFGVHGLLSMWQNGILGWETLLTREGVQIAIAPIFPVLLVLEFTCLLYLRRQDMKSVVTAYKYPVLNYFINPLLLLFVTLDIFFFSYEFFSQYEVVAIPVTWYGFLYAVVVWELAHFVFHFTCHKVRLLWCLHSPHHSPLHMNLSVIFTGFFLHGVYANFVRTTICAVLGAPLPLLILIMAIDGCWGALIHIGHDIMPSGKLGFLSRFILTPSHHRVHHARNPEYIDKNYCNTLPIWDRIFGTYQDEIKGIKPQYGLVRNANYDSFIDMYFGEFILLLRDIRRAPTIWQAVLHMLMPPGWQPKGSARTEPVPTSIPKQATPQ